MLYFVMTAGFKDVIETYEIALDIGIGIGDAITDTGLGREVNDYGNLILSENLLDGTLVGYGSMYESPVSVQGLDFLQSLILDVYVIVIGDGINAYNFDILHVVKQTFDEVTADESGRTGDENRFPFEVYIIRYHIF